MSNVPNISTNVGEAPTLHTSPYKKRKKKLKEKIKKYLEYNKKLKKKVTVGDVMKKINSKMIRRKDLED